MVLGTCATRIAHRLFVTWLAEKAVSSPPMLTRQRPQFFESAITFRMLASTSSIVLEVPKEPPRR